MSQRRRRKRKELEIADEDRLQIVNIERIISGVPYPSTGITFQSSTYGSTLTGS